MRKYGVQNVKLMSKLDFFFFLRNSHLISHLSIFLRLKTNLNLILLSLKHPPPRPPNQGQSAIQSKPIHWEQQSIYLSPCVVFQGQLTTEVCDVTSSAHLHSKSYASLLTLHEEKGLAMLSRDNKNSPHAFSPYKVCPPAVLSCFVHFF